MPLAVRGACLAPACTTARCMCCMCTTRQLTAHRMSYNRVSARLGSLRSQPIEVCLSATPTLPYPMQIRARGRHRGGRPRLPAARGPAGAGGARIGGVPGHARPRRRPGPPVGGRVGGRHGARGGGADAVRARRRGARLPRGAPGRPAMTPLPGPSLWTESAPLEPFVLQKQTSISLGVCIVTGCFRGAE